MDYRKVIGALGIILMLLGASMALPLLWSLYYGEYDWSAFLTSSIVTFLTGLTAYRFTGVKDNFNSREAYAVVALSWLLASLFGAIPYLLSGAFTTVGDAVFETMSGFTTTGASVLSNVEALPHGVLFWRSLTHWLGGMGIIVLFVAILSSLGAGGMQMFKAESPGPVAEKITPRISGTAKILWYTYLALTVIQTVLLLVLGMPLFDALCHSFATVATGGFSIKNASIGYYNNPLIDWVIIVFMFLAGANFILHYEAFRGRNLKYFWQNAEFRLYALIVFTAGAIIAFSLFKTTDLSVGATLRQSFFQVVSIITTTGYFTADFDQWVPLAKAVLVILMFIGGCAGSTGGSVKVGRILIMLKQCRVELQRVVHPRAIGQPKIDGKTISPETLLNVLQFFFIFIGVVCLSTLVMVALGLDLVSAFTAVITTLGNVGPGLGKVGPVQNFGFLSDVGKYYLSFLMMLGRLELYTVLVLFMPSFWRK